MSIHALMLVAAALAAAPPPSSPSDALIRVSGPLVVERGESVGTAIVVNGDATIDGVVLGQLVVINGTAVVRGELARGVTVFNGRLVLEPAARADGSIVLYRSALERHAEALVSGRIVYEIIPSFREVAWLFWVATTLVLVLAVLVYTFLARAQLTGAAELLRRQPARVGLAAVTVVLGVPATAFVLVLTGIGVPVALTLLLFVLPVLALLGYMITGTSVGQLMTHMEPRLRNPYLAAALGVLVLQLLAAVPPLGGLFALLATQIGAGALAYYVWRTRRDAVRAAG